MAFSLPTRHPHHFNPEVLLILLGLLLLLLSMLLAVYHEQAPRERMVPNSEVAKVALANKQNPVVDVIGQSRAASGQNAVITASVQAGPLEAALTDLLKGPSAAEIKAGQYSEIPKGTELLGVSVSGNTVTVNLSDEFASGGGSTSMLERVDELKRTVNGVNRAYNVKIAINGRLIEYLGGEGLEVN